MKNQLRSRTAGFYTFSSFLVLAACFLLSAPLSAQVNDNCAGAISLTPGASCTPTAGSTLAATQTLAPAICTGFGASQANDLWYTFVAAAPTQVVTVDGAANMDAVLQAFSGACNGTHIFCTDATSADGIETLTLTGLTTGNTYLARVYDFFSSGGDFTICVTTPAPVCVASPTSPSNGQTSVCPGPVALSWPAQGAATSYDVYFGTTAVPPFVANVVGSTYNAGSLAAGTYFWQVRPRNSTGVAAGCTVWSFTVGDAMAPSITCPASVTTTNSPATACGAVATYGATSAIDNCSAPAIVLISGLASGSTFPGGVTTNVFRATDGTGNSSTCSFTVTVNDITAPSITCPASVMVNSASNACSAVATYGSTGATDNCTAPAITLVSGPASGSTFPIGVTTIIFRATDPSNNSNTCSFTVTVKDVTPPVASCKNATVNLASNGSITLLPATVNNASSDNCSFTLSVTPNTFSCSNLGANIVTLRATDPSGNSSTCTATVTVKDVTPPTAVCPPLTVFLNIDGQASIVPSQIGGTSSDACGITTMTISKSQFNCSHINGSPVSVILTLKDASNNQSTCNGQVYVKDNTAPYAVCNNRTVVLNSSGNVTVQTSTVASNSADNCSVVTFFPTAKVYYTSNIGVNNLTVTVKDFSNNSATCVSQITVLPFGSSALISSNNSENDSHEAETPVNRNKLDLSLSPNPTSGESTLKFYFEEEQPYQLRLFDLNGRLIMDTNFHGYAGENVVALELGNLLRGIYLVEVQSAGMWGREKVVVQE